jgi:hypothetical protein
MELTVLSAAHAQLVPLLESGQAGAESSFIKIAGTTLLHRLSDLLFEAASALGGGHGPITPGELTLHPAIAFLQNRRATIYGGTQEIPKRHRCEARARTSMMDTNSRRRTAADALAAILRNV